MGTLVDRDVEEHRAEITRQNRTTPAIVLVVLVCAVVAVLFTSSSADDHAPGPAATTTAPAGTTSTKPPPTVTTVGASSDGPEPIVGIATGGGRLFVFGTRKPRVMGATVAPGLELRFGSPAVAVGNLVAVLGSDRSVLAGREATPFQPVACCFDDLIAADLPGAVWAIEGTSRAELVDLVSGPTGDEMDLDGDTVVGVAPTGLVTLDSSGRASWRQPVRDPVPIDVPEDRSVVSSGGGLVATVVSGTGAVELRRIDDGQVVRTIAARAIPAGVLLSTSGDAVAITVGGSTTVYSTDDGRRIGRIEDAGSTLVPVGDQRFAAIVADTLVDSATGEMPLAARPIIVATRAG